MKVIRRKATTLGDLEIKWLQKLTLRSRGVMENYLDEVIDDECPHVITIATVDGEWVGWCLITPEYILPNPSKESMRNPEVNVYVLKAHQRKGYGSRLVRLAMKDWVKKVRKLKSKEPRQTFIVHRHTKRAEKFYDEHFRQVKGTECARDTLVCYTPSKIKLSKNKNRKKQKV
jgi:GNAT superfamily N-acetyltransferase